MCVAYTWSFANSRIKKLGFVYNVILNKIKFFCCYLVGFKVSNRDYQDNTYILLIYDVLE